MLISSNKLSSKKIPFPSLDNFDYGWMLLWEMYFNPPYAIGIATELTVTWLRYEQSKCMGWLFFLGFNIMYIKVHKLARSTHQPEVWANGYNMAVVGLQECSLLGLKGHIFFSSCCPPNMPIEREYDIGVSPLSLNRHHVYYPVWGKTLNQRFSWANAFDFVYKLRFPRIQCNGFM